MTDYSKMTHDEFYGILVEIMDRMTAPEILAVPGIWAIMSEEMNNEVLDVWASRQEPEDEIIWEDDDE